MVEVQELPESEDEDAEDDGAGEDEEEEDGEVEDGQQEEGDGLNGDLDDVDKKTVKKNTVDRLEALRLNRALGNDDPDLPPDSPPSTSESEPKSESEFESDKDEGSDLPPPTDITTYSRATPRTRRPKRAGMKKLETGDGVRDVVLRERERGERTQTARRGAKEAGKVKGHKWKTNEKYLVGKNSVW